MSVKEIRVRIIVARAGVAAPVAEAVARSYSSGAVIVLAVRSQYC